MNAERAAAARDAGAWGIAAISALWGMKDPHGAAMKMLENEGFAYEGYVDIFDGGPTMIARTDAVASVAGAQACEVHSVTLDKGERALFAAGRLGYCP